VVSENKDITFSPRLYDHEEILLQTEYRQANLNSNHISDFSFKANNNKKLQSHFFYNYDKKVDIDNFVTGNFNVKIQATSKDTYIKKNNIKSDITNIENTLENSAKFDMSKENLQINFETIIYEDLNKNESDRFEYLIPKIDLTKKLNFENDFNGDFVLKSLSLSKIYDTNIKETTNINDLIYQSYPKISKKGIYNNYELIIKNINSNASNSINYKNKESSYLNGLIQFNSSLPLIKENENSQKILNPRLSLKLSPSHTKDIRNKDVKIDINNIYSLNRISESDIIEGGLSLSYGNKFSIIDKDSNSDVFSINLANNLRLKENDDLPKNSQIGQKTSSFMNEINYKPVEEIEFNYNSSIKNNLSQINYENFNSKFKINNIVSTFDYLNENETNNNISYLSNKTDLIIDNSNLISFSTRKNKTINLTEYYKLAYQYKNDCLAASIEYNKDFYNDRDLRPNESIFFKLSIIPFNKDEAKFLK
jgi:LPS-assembly protein